MPREYHQKDPFNHKRTVKHIKELQDDIPGPIAHPPGTCQDPENCTFVDGGCNCYAAMGYTELDEAGQPKMGKKEKNKKTNG